MYKTGKINGHAAFWMENDFVRVSVLPEKGCDIFEWVYKPLGIDILMKTPTGLKPPSGSNPTHFLENYEGAWQELFPNANKECLYRDHTIPFHGEVALLPWNYELVKDNEQETTVLCSVTCQATPFQLDKVLSLKDNAAIFEIKETITNLSELREHYIGGQHLVLGGDFLEVGCQIITDASIIETPDEISEETARLMPSKHTKYPYAMHRKTSELVDLSFVQPPEIHSHDDAFITGFTNGIIEVKNPIKKVSVKLEWNLNIFPWMVLWQPYGGADDPPLTGTYGLGIEPWVSRYNLVESIQRNCAASLEPHESMQTSFRLTINTF